MEKSRRTSSAPGYQIRRDSKARRLQRRAIRMRALEQKQSPPEMQLDPVVLYRAFDTVSERTEEEVLGGVLGGIVAMMVKYMGAKRAKHTLVELLLNNDFWSGLETLQPEIERLCKGRVVEFQHIPPAPTAPQVPKRKHTRKAR